MILQQSGTESGFAIGLIRKTAFFPHISPKLPEISTNLSRIYLAEQFVWCIILHNVPDGGRGRYPGGY